MKVISFLNPKGGSGKTTAVINIATCLKREGHTVAVVDTDPQGSLTFWNREKRSSFDVYTADDEKDVYKVRKELANYDFVVIDGAGSLSVITSAAVMVSDLVIIPIKPSPLDFSAAGSVITVLEAQAFSREVEARLLITCKVENTSMLTLLKQSIAASTVQPLKTCITQRQSYIKSLVDGRTVFDTKDNGAKGEIEILAKEICGALADPVF